MHGVKSSPEARLKAIGDRVFCETFKSLQLLGFTVLYYDFNMETTALTDFNNRMHEKNAELLDSTDLYDAAVDKIEKLWNCKLSKKIMEFPYRPRVKMMGGLPKGKVGLQSFNMANLQSYSAIESFLVLTFSVLIERNRRFGKTQMDLFWSNLKANSENYAKGMTDRFIVEYFQDQLNLQLNG